MKYQHKQLAACRWLELSFLEQMSNVVSEGERSPVAKVFLPFQLRVQDEHPAVRLHALLDLLRSWVSFPCERDRV